MPMLTDALQSGTILLREGLEAVLVITALAVFLLKSGHVEKIRVLYGGALAALLASVAAAALFEYFLGGAHDDRIEAAVMAVAAVLMFYMSGWLFLKQDGRAWQADLQRAAQRALGAGTTFSLGAIAFLAVFREGAETILFLYALGKSGTGYSAGFWLGLVAASFAVAGIFMGLRWFALRLPLRPLFMATSAFLFAMGIRFTGANVQELQETALIDVTPLDMPQWMIAAGFNPSWEAATAQIAIALLALAGTAFAALRGRQKGVPAIQPA